MRVLLSIIFLSTLSTISAKDDQHLTFKTLPTSSEVTVESPEEKQNELDTIALRPLPLPTENKHQFRYLFKRCC